MRLAAELGTDAMGNLQRYPIAASPNSLGADSGKERKRIMKEKEMEVNGIRKMWKGYRSEDRVQE